MIRLWNLFHYSCIMITSTYYRLLSFNGFKIMLLYAEINVKYCEGILDILDCKKLNTSTGSAKFNAVITQNVIWSGTMSQMSGTLSSRYIQLYIVAILSKPCISISGGKWLFVFNRLPGVLRNWWWCFHFQNPIRKQEKWQFLCFSRTRMSHIASVLGMCYYNSHNGTYEVLNCTYESELLFNLCAPILKWI